MSQLRLNRNNHGNTLISNTTHLLRTFSRSTTRTTNPHLAQAFDLGPNAGHLGLSVCKNPLDFSRHICSAPDRPSTATLSLHRMPKIGCVTFAIHYKALVSAPCKTQPSLLSLQSVAAQPISNGRLSFKPTPIVHISQSICRRPRC